MNRKPAPLVARDMVATPPSTTVVFVLIPNFSLIAFASAIEPLRIVNRVCGRPLYRWTIVSADGKPVRASNGLEANVAGSILDLQSAAIDINRPDYIFVCSGVEVEKFQHGDFSGWLQRQHRRGVTVGGLCTGAWLLAKAGLLAERRCAIHWETLPAFAETFPDADVHADLFEDDDNIYTCAGGTAALDLMLHIIGEQHDADIIAKVCELCLVDRVRSSGDRQRLPLRARIGIYNTRLLQLIELMERNIAVPVTLEEMSREAKLSRRHIERLFRQNLGRSPARYYLELRLERARHLLLQSDMPIVDVAIACGFVSASHFSKCYRGLFGRSPQADRRSQGAADTGIAAAEAR